MDKSRFGPFAFEGRLDEHGESSVYRAIHLGQKRMVAVKLFSAPLAATNPAAKQALVAEIETLKKLTHWNVVRCFGGILEEMDGCLAYELVQGESLGELLERRSRLAWETVVDYAFQITSGLECAHEQGVVHQDLRPEKILIAEDGTVKVADLRVNRSQNRRLKPRSCGAGSSSCTATSPSLQPTYNVPKTLCIRNRPTAETLAVHRRSFS
jgi:serine/threonine protein kinase